MLKYLIKKPHASKDNYEFKLVHSFEKRLEESTKIKSNNPNKIPIVIEKSDNSSINNIDRHKFIIPKEFTVGQFIYTIRQQIKLNEYQALFLFVNNTMIPPCSETFETIYEKHADKDGFLYVTYAGENTFGIKN